MNRKRSAWRTVGLTIPALALLMGSGRAPDSHSQSGPSNGSSLQQGLRIAPVHLNLRGKNRTYVAIGSYLVNAVGGCNDCHTCPSYAPGVEHNPYVGGDGKINDKSYLAGGLDFALGPDVTVTSANLTPDSHGRPASLTFYEFRDLIRTGHEGDHILQVMPWPVFRNMTNTDLRAIYEYLSAIPSRPMPPPGTCQVPGQGTLPTR